MAKKHRFLQTAYANGFPEFEAGKAYEPSERTAVYLATGVAEEIDLADPAPDADADTGKKGKKGKKGEGGG